MSTMDRMTHLARLARLSPTENDLARFGAQCDEIIKYMDNLSQVDTEGVAPLYSPMEGSASRDDSAVARDLHKAVLANAPEHDDDFFIVPRIV